MQALADLQAAVADAKSTPAQIAEKVAAVRAAREKARASLAVVARIYWSCSLPIKQAVLVGLGYID